MVDRFSALYYFLVVLQHTNNHCHPHIGSTTLLSGKAFNSNITVLINPQCACAMVMVAVGVCLSHAILALQHICGNFKPSLSASVQQSLLNKTSEFTKTATL